MSTSSGFAGDVCSGSLHQSSVGEGVFHSLVCSANTQTAEFLVAESLVMIPTWVNAFF